MLITGASSALGRATALAFSKHGAKLALVEHQIFHTEEFFTPLHKNEGNSCNLHLTYKLKRISNECKNLGNSTDDEMINYQAFFDIFLQSRPTRVGDI